MSYFLRKQIPLNAQNILRLKKIFSEFGGGFSYFSEMDISTAKPFDEVAFKKKLTDLTYIRGSHWPGRTDHEPQASPPPRQTAEDETESPEFLEIKEKCTDLACIRANPWPGRPGTQPQAILPARQPPEENDEGPDSLTSAEVSPRSTPLYFAIPRDWAVTCVVRPWSIGEYIVEVEKRKTTWHMGVKLSFGEASPRLTWRSWRVFFAVMTLIGNSTSASTSCCEICKRLNISKCGEGIRRLRDDLLRFTKYFVRAEGPAGTYQFPLLESCGFHENDMGNGTSNWGVAVSISPEFRAILDDPQTARKLRFDFLRDIHSPTAGAILLFLPSWVAAQARANDAPAKLKFATLAKFLRTGNENPRPPGQIRKLLTQNSREKRIRKKDAAPCTPPEGFRGIKGSVIEQMDGARMVGGLFRCAIDGEEISCWKEETKGPANARLLEVFLSGGGVREQYDRFMSAQCPLPPETWERIRALGVPPSYRRFCEMAYRLLGGISLECFSGIIDKATSRFPKMAVMKAGSLFATMVLNVAFVAPRRNLRDNNWWKAAADGKVPVTGEAKPACAKEKELA